ncbi:MAG: hypothetical protein JO001_00430 [Alphaproteobacteria bacterium]|nr:hypothetical protein [Alphaproteobacteria bacterium]
MRLDISGDSPQKRERRPVARTAHLENQNNSTDNHSAELAEIQRATRYLRRRHLLSLSVAAVVATELGLGGGNR